MWRDPIIINFDCPYLSEWRSNSEMEKNIGFFLFCRLNWWQNCRVFHRDVPPSMFAGYDTPCWLYPIKSPSGWFQAIWKNLKNRHFFGSSSRIKRAPIRSALLIYPYSIYMYLARLIYPLYHIISPKNRSIFLGSIYGVFHESHWIPFFFTGPHPTDGNQMAKPCRGSLGAVL